MSDEIEIETPKPQLIPPEEWDTLTIGQLYEQQSILFDRWIFLTENSYPYADEMKKAIDKIAALIAKK
jgi:hypothetical protein